MTGAAGNDTYVFDTDLALGSDTLNEAGGGIDTLDFSSTTTRSVAVDLSNGAAQVVNAGLTLALGLGNTVENVIGGSLADTLTGNALANTFTGGAGNDTMTGAAGNDTYLFDTDLALGSDTLNESGGGIDTLDFSATTTRSVAISLANAGAQAVNPGLTLTLGVGTPVENVIGGSLADTLGGNALANTLTGGAGSDTLTGLGGQDTFNFVAALNAATNVDFVSDFVALDDRFLLDDAVFAGIGPVGQIAAANFVAGAAAGDASDRVIYDAPTGQLFFDADGSGAGAQVLFATVVGGTTVNFDDIWIA
jgi:Ca2+-binding RTX toxin-like protein